MSSIITRKNYKILDPTPSNPGGVALNDNFTRAGDDVEALTAADAVNAAAVATAIALIASLTTTVGGKLAAASNLSDLANAATARSNLGLGSAATTASTAYDAAGAAAAVNTSLAAHTSNTSNPHSTTAAQVGAYTTAQVDTALSGKAAATHTHAESDVTGLTTDLAAKCPTARTISTTAPLTGGGDLSANRTIAFSNATANTVLAGPTTGSAAAPAFRALVTADIPSTASASASTVVKRDANAVSNFAAVKLESGDVFGSGYISHPQGKTYAAFSNVSNRRPLTMMGQHVANASGLTEPDTANYGAFNWTLLDDTMVCAPVVNYPGEIITLRINANGHTLTWGARIADNPVNTFASIATALGANPTIITLRADTAADTADAWEIIDVVTPNVPNAFAITNPTEGTGYTAGDSIVVRWNDTHSYVVDADATTLGTGNSGGINAPNDVGSHSVTVNGVTINYTVNPAPVLGCTNPDANNYNPDATEDDGSCTFDPPTTLSISVPSDGATFNVGDTFFPDWGVDAGSDDATVTLGGWNAGGGGSGAVGVDTSSFSPGTYTLTVTANNYLAPSNSITITLT